MHRIVAIHQPNFFPWLGYFDKIRRSDVFVFLDDVQYQKTGGTWSNRVRILTNGEGRWLTAPIDRSFHGTRRVNEICFLSGDNWRDMVLEKLHAYYSLAKYFREAMGLLCPIIAFPGNTVADYNINAVTTLAVSLGIQGNRFVRSSTIPTSHASTQRLIEIASNLHGTDYLCGGGADGYQDDDLFASAGISLVYQNFMHPHYLQAGTDGFKPGLSIIDVLMHCGLRQASALLCLDSGAPFLGAEK